MQAAKVPWEMFVDVVERGLVKGCDFLRVVQPHHGLAVDCRPVLRWNACVKIADAGVEDLFAALRREVFIVHDRRIQEQADLEMLALSAQAVERLDHWRDALGGEVVERRRRRDTAAVLAGLAPVVRQDEVDAGVEHVAELLDIPVRVHETHRGLVGGVIRVHVRARRRAAGQSQAVEPVEEIGRDDRSGAVERFDWELAEVW